MVALLFPNNFKIEYEYKDNQMSKQHKGKSVELPIEWIVPDDMVSRYATNMVVQSTEHEFIISFFEMKPPLIVGDQAKISERVSELTSLPAVCIARIIVASDKMPEFVDALKRNLQSHQGNMETESKLE